MSFNLNAPDHELQEMIDREERRSETSTKISCIVVAVIGGVVLFVLIGGLVFLGKKIYEARRDTARRTARTTGCLVGVTEYFSLVMGTGYTVRYTFAINGQPYEGDGALDQDPGKPDNCVTTVVVVFEQGNPDNNQVENDLGPWGPLASKKMWLWFGTACLVIFVLSLIKDALLRSFRRKTS